MQGISVSNHIVINVSSVYLYLFSVATVISVGYCNFIIVSCVTFRNVYLCMLLLFQ